MEHLTLQLLGKFQLFLDRSGTFLFSEEENSNNFFFIIMEQLDKIAVTEISFELVLFRPNSNCRVLIGRKSHVTALTGISFADDEAAFLAVARVHGIDDFAHLTAVQVLQEVVLHNGVFD